MVASSGISETDIAIVGMAVRVPGASTLTEFWENLRGGVESIRRLDEEELLAAGENPERMADPNYVPAAAPLQGYADFDAEFFGFSPKEAAILDPQHRKFLEVAWEAMENAGHSPGAAGRVGVYAGCGMGSYFYFNICSNPGLVDEVGMFLLRHTGNDKDFLSTRASHVFDLHGPSVNVQTACSTSLVAVHYACKALRDGDCDMALAGGATIELPQGRGYLYKENEILSPDGHCYAFDHRAQGTVFGSGAGVVALKRLKDAIADGDHVWAVIKGSAINNDGAAKAGYLAPSVDGQAEAVAAALRAADVPADTVDYVECHGTGTYLGDPIEVSALTQAFRETTEETGFCRIGSVKTNIGHLDTAAGVASLIKTALALHHRQIPPSLGYEAPNPAIDFDHSPFLVADRLTDWVPHKGPRRAGVNSLGVGGTNAHVVLEEAPARPPSEESDFPFQILCISGRGKAALEANSQALAAHLRAHPGLPLADVAFTLEEGRRGFEKRRVLVAETTEEAAELLETGDPLRVFTHDVLGDAPEVVFMFPGGGAQYAGMARDLYETEPVFAEWMDRGLEHLQKRLDYDIRAIWLPEDGARTEAEARLRQPSVQLPLIMIVEYALAQLWISWGVRPAAMVGHSMGENTAACLAGVLSFEDCIDLVLLRGRLFDTVPAGGMLSVSLPVDELRALIGDHLDIASVNAPDLTAVSGPQAALDRLAADLEARGVDHQRIQIDIAAHSRMLDPILDDFRAFLRGLELRPPKLPVISNRTGRPLAPEQATSPDYWADQLRNTVLFADCIDHLAAEPGRVFLEVGPGKALSSLAQMNPGVKAGQVLSSLRHPDQEMPDDAYFLGVIGRLWACGVEADWTQIWGEARRNRVPLPTYAFQTRRYFIEPGKAADRAEAPAPVRDDNIDGWGWRPVWRPRHADCALDVDSELGDQPLNWLLFEDETGLGAAVATRLEQAGHFVARVRSGDIFARLAEGRYTLAPEQGREGYDALLADLAAQGRLPDRIAHLWLVTDRETFRPGSSLEQSHIEHGFHSLTALGQALGGVDLPGPVHVVAATTGAAARGDEALRYPEKAMIAGPLGVMPRELPGVTCAWLDLHLPMRARGGFLARRRRADGAAIAPLVRPLLEELVAEPGNTVALWRDGRRFAQEYRPVKLDAADAPAEGGTWLITGGFGGIGLTVAADLIRRGGKIALVSRRALPPREDWARHLRMHAPADRVSRMIRAMRELDSLAEGSVMALAADVTNIEAMRAAVAQAEQRLGKITGVIHAAGHIEDAPLLAKTDDSIARVLAPKVAGLRVLDQLFPDGALDMMVLFSSSSTATRPAGQVDYIAANAFLDAWAQARRGGWTRVVTVNWGVWAETGMAAEAMAGRARAQSAPPEPASAPMLDETGFDLAGCRLFVSRLSTDLWVLDQHRTADGVALMPGTGFVELAAEALVEHGETSPFEIRDLYFFRPLNVDDRTPREVVVRLEPRDGGYDLTVHGQLPGGGYALHAQARIVTREDAAHPDPIDLGAVAERCGDARRAAPGGHLRSPQEAHLHFGPRWHVLRAAALGQGEGLARLHLPQEALQDPGDGYRLHPGLLDLATGWAIELAPSYEPSHLWVPVSYGSVRVHAPLPAEISSWVRLAEGREDGTATFHVTLTDGDGRILVEIRDFRMQRLAAGLDFAPPAQPDADAAALGLVAPEPAPLSPAEKRLHHQIRQGIRPDEGPQALRRALATGLPRVVVSSLPLPDLIAQADIPAEPESGPPQSFDRPDLETDYAAPRTELERALAAQFETLLGVSRVGIDDSFFDLGGHSLIAVRLFAQIKRDFGADFPISMLFEAPTVAALAERIAAATGGGAEPATGDAPRPTPTEQGSRSSVTRSGFIPEARPGKRRFSSSPACMATC
ncbi:SDR family NAD(P)-dependent oxidoreductase [Jhaorihella thermophila]|uniref:type I polyketide synthase n=1 Tax=Jhaorihella thermophila TaxID=488547 RepID=UPI0036D3E004